MESIVSIVAQNIKRIRTSNRLSLEELARLSGVSKSTIASIERGEGNPTLSLLWKLANALRVPFDSLTVRSKSDFEISRLNDIEPIIENDGKLLNYSIFPDDQNRNFSVFYMRLKSGCRWCSEPHIVNTTEFIYVISGAVEIKAGDTTVHLKKNEGVHFQSDVPHEYRNTSDNETQLYLIMYCPAIRSKI